MKNRNNFVRRGSRKRGSLERDLGIAEGNRKGKRSSLRRGVRVLGCVERGSGLCP